MKISVVGAGNVGGTLAQRIVESGLGEVVLVDIAGEIARGKSLDLADARSILKYSSSITGATDYKKISGSDIVVVTAGLARQPGMTREDLLKKNSGITKQIVSEIVKYAKDSILIIVTNPLDILTNLALKASGFDKKRVMGMGGVLDSSRFENLIAEELSISPECVQALVIGAHGQDMIPLPRYSNVSGISIEELLPSEKIKELIEKTVKRGAEIVSCLGKGSAYYAPSAAAFSMVKAIIRDEKKIIPACVSLNGEYGLADVCIGVPARLGREGIEEVIELKLTEAEKKQLQTAAKEIKTASANLS